MNGKKLIVAIISLVISGDVIAQVTADSPDITVRVEVPKHEGLNAKGYLFLGPDDGDSMVIVTIHDAPMWIRFEAAHLEFLLGKYKAKDGGFPYSNEIDDSTLQCVASESIASDAEHSYAFRILLAKESKMLAAIRRDISDGGQWRGEASVLKVTLTGARMK